MKKVTLKQIAEMSGVSMTTVHRVLNGKGGCSRELEEKILQIAREQGYSINLVASNLRKQPIQIALLFPFHDNGGRFFLDRILDGYLDYRREAAKYNVVFQEFLLRTSEEKRGDYTDMAYPELEHILQQIYMELPVRYDGIVIYGMTVTRKAEALLNRIVGRGTKVVVLERSLPGLEDSCTVKTNKAVAGRMAAEMLGKVIGNSGTVAVLSQLIPDGDLSAQACIEALHAERPNLNVVEIPLGMNAYQGELISQKLEKYTDLAGLYITCGRHTASALEAAKMRPDSIRTIIGSELFQESYDALHSGMLDCIVDNRPEKLGYTALYFLLNALARGNELPQVYYVTPRIIIRANSDVYFREREALSEREFLED